MLEEMNIKLITLHLLKMSVNTLSGNSDAASIMGISYVDHD